MFSYRIFPSSILFRLQNAPQPLKPRPQPTADGQSLIPPPSVQTQTKVLRHIVLDGQNIARKYEEYEFFIFVQNSLFYFIVPMISIVYFLGVVYQMQ